MKDNFKRTCFKISVFFLFCQFVISPGVSAEENKDPQAAKPKFDSASIWGYRRGPKAPDSPESLAAKAQSATPEETLAKALEIKKKSEDRKAETERAIAEMESGY